MKHLNALHDKLHPINERTEPHDIPTYLDIILDSLTHMPGRNARESIRFFKLALKLESLKEPFGIDSIEYEMMKEACTQNPKGYVAWAHGQMMLKILEWDRQAEIV